MPESRQLYVTLPAKSLEDLKIRLKHDKISPNTFLSLVIDAYLAGDPDMQKVVMNYKDRQDIGRTGARKIERKIYKTREENIKDFNLNDHLDENDLNDLFDILESEWENT